MKKLIALALVVMFIFTGGCYGVKSVKGKMVTRERVDQQVTGNQGVIFGEVPEAKVPDKPKTREFYKVDVEVYPLFGAKEEKPALVKEKTYQEPALEEDVYLEFEEETTEGIVVRPQEVDIVEEDVVTIQSKEVDYYTVKKGQSLWDISKEVYGRGSKWVKIYEANKNTLKDPNALRPGMMLIIPKEAGDVQRITK
jgi:LysM repeat protein